MQDEIISLCIPAFNYIENKIDNKLWRIADFSQKEKIFRKATYTEKGDDEFLPRKINVGWKDVETFYANIFSWSVNESNIVRSEKYVKRPIEIIRLDDSILLNHNNDITIRNLLYKGINGNKYLADEFLLVINQDGNFYEVMHCKLKMFNNNFIDKIAVQKTCQDITKVIHTVNIYTISYNDVLSTEGLNINYSCDETAPIRYFYNKLEFPRATRKFYLREPEDYAKAFISKYVRAKKDVLELTIKDIKKITNVIQQTLNNKEEISAFYAATEYDIHDVEYALNNLSKETIDVYLKNEKLSEIVEKSLLENQEVRDEYLKQAEKIWLDEQNELKVSVEENIVKTKLELKKIENQVNEVVKALWEHNLVSDELNNKINQLTVERDSLKSEIEKLKSDAQSELASFQENVIKLASITALTKNAGNNVVNQDEILHISGLLNECIDEAYADNLADFIDDLNDNLKCFGISKKYSEALASYVVSSIVAKKQLIVCGGKSEVLANALSYLISKNDAEQLFLPVGFTNINTIVNKINNMERKVILLHNFIDTYNESIFSTIIKLCSDKILIFNCEDYQTYLNLPKHWSQYATYISIIDIFEKPTGEELLFGEFNLEIFNDTIDIPEIKLCDDKIIKSMLEIDSLYLPNIHALNEVYQISVSDELNSLDIKYFIIKNILIVNPHIISIFDFESVGISSKKQKKYFNGIVYE